jgi:hypothetical protein
MMNLLNVQGWGIGMGWGIALILAVLVIVVGIYYKIRKK